MTTFKLIKTTKHKDNVNFTHVVAYKGRAMVLSTLSFDDQSKIKVDATAKTVSIDEDIAVVQRAYIDPETSMQLTGLNVMPKFDIAVDAF